jgi:acyl-CoA thioester hydrolase
MPTDFAYRHRLSVRFRDCDGMGHVNHAVYFTYLEQCRLTFWREATGTPSPHTRVIVARAECDYRAPAYFGDELEVRLRSDASDVRASRSSTRSGACPTSGSSPRARR